MAVAARPHNDRRRRRLHALGGAPGAFDPDSAHEPRAARGGGSLDFGATALYGVANRGGALSIVAVAGSLYPVATVLLARSVLAERLVRAQALGVGLALAGVALIAA